MNFMNDKNKKNNGSTGLLIGMCIGLAIGTAVGAATHNIGLWIPIGLCLGLALGHSTNGKNDGDAGDKQ